jgi:hypothetical protein
VVWQEGKAESGLRPKTRPPCQRAAMLARLKMSRDFDPKLIVERLYQLQNDDKVQVKMKTEFQRRASDNLNSNGFRDTL